MKSNFIKYIFIIFVIVIIGAVIYKENKRGVILNRDNLFLGFRKVIR